MGARDVPDEAYFFDVCELHGRTQFVDIMGDDYCVLCMAEELEGDEE